MTFRYSIPGDVRGAFGGLHEFVESFGEIPDDEAQAVIAARAAQRRLEIKAARKRSAVLTVRANPTFDPDATCLGEYRAFLKRLVEEEGVTPDAL